MQFARKNNKQEMDAKDVLSDNSLAQNETVDNTKLDHLINAITPNNKFDNAKSQKKDVKDQDTKNKQEKETIKTKKDVGFNLFKFLKSIGKSNKKIDKADNKDEDSEQSSGDEKLSKAFGVELSYTMTPKIDANNTGSEEIENPDIEKSMLNDELRMLKFLNDDDEEESNYNKNSTKYIDNIQTSYTQSDHKKIYTSEGCLNPKDVTVIKRKDNELDSIQLNETSNNDETQYNDCNLIYIEDKDVAPSSNISIINSDKNNLWNTHPEEDSNTTSCNGKINMNNSLFFPHYTSNMNTSLINNLEIYDINHNYYTSPTIYEPCYYNKKPVYKKNFSKNGDMSEFDISIDEIYKKAKTTLMIRNIPNKYTKELMLETINAEFNDAYDFFYLPIDFNNNCNVGYAFINFKALKYIEPFYNKFDGKKWPIFNSEKICSIKYARIQGKNECSRHFRGTSLMRQSVR